MQDLIIILSAKWWPPAQHDVHDDSHGPVVALGCVGTFQDLWGDVVWSTVRRGHQLVRRHLLRKTEIYQLDMRIVVVLVQKEILRFNISIEMSELVRAAPTYDRYATCADSRARKMTIS